MTARTSVYASQAIPLEFPELHVQRLYLPAGTNMLTNPILATVEAVRRGWLGWLADVAARSPAEVDLFLREPAQPPRVPRLLSQPAITPNASVDATIDRRAVYLLTGGSGGLGGALLSWLVQQQAVPPEQIVLLSRRGGASPLPGVRSLAVDVSDASSLQVRAWAARVSSLMAWCVGRRMCSFRTTGFE